jgi:Flp pilus assembly protein TadG
MRRSRGERGQVLAVVAVVLVALLGVAAFAIDVGYAYYAKRQLQSATDAAALAGAQDLPTIATAIATATDYAAYNTPANLAGKLSFTYQTKCTAQAIAAVSCVATAPNDLTVSGTASTDTWFARMFGINHFNVSTHANACSPCSSTPVDIVIVIDRTGSMCSETDSGGCIDLNFAKGGVRTMLKALNPAYANVGMVAFPPVQSTSSTYTCLAPYNSLSTKVDTTGRSDDAAMNGYDASTRGYVTDQLNHVYKLANGDLDPASGLYKHTVGGDATACIQSAYSTSYTEALRQAKKELAARGRVNVPDFIVFFTDGEANIGSVYAKTDLTFPMGGADDQKPCQSAEALASGYKTTDKITIYTIGYDLGNANCTGGGFHQAKAGGGYSSCTTPSTTCWHYRDAVTEREPDGTTITSNETLDDIASDGKFFNQPSPGDLTATFAAIAADIGSGASRLVDDSY